MSKIIEKLGIGYEPSVGTITCNSPLAKKLIGDFQEAHIPVENKAMAQCKKAAPEMLEALIEASLCIETKIDGKKCNHTINVCYCKDMMYLNKCIIVIQKATGKSWEEIKELLK